MSAQFMRRNIRISVRLTEEEHRLLKEKMARIGVTNQEAFLRKMALDGLVIRLDLPELKQMISLLRYTSNNINQIAKRLNESGRTYDTDLAEILEEFDQKHLVLVFRLLAKEEAAETFSYMNSDTREDLINALTDPCSNAGIRSLHRKT